MQFRSLARLATSVRFHVQQFMHRNSFTPSLQLAYPGLMEQENHNSGLGSVLEDLHIWLAGPKSKVTLIQFYLLFMYINLIFCFLNLCRFPQHGNEKSTDVFSLIELIGFNVKDAAKQRDLIEYAQRMLIFVR
jgi:hypothetical protein